MDKLPEGLWAELLLASVGMKRALSRDPLRLLVRDREAATALPRKIVAAFRSFYGGDAAPRARPLVEGYDWPWIRDRLAEPVELADVEGNVQGFTDPAEAASFAALVERVRAQLRAAAPQRGRQSLTGVTPTEPSDTDAARFRRTWDVANDPTVILDDLQSGILTRGQVRAFSELYPALAQYTRAAALAGLAKRLSDAPRYQVPWERDLALRTLLGVVAWPPGLAAELQATVAAQREGGGAPGGPAPTLDAGAEAATTPVQRVAAK
jgi:hypothetical protein